MDELSAQQLGSSQTLGQYRMIFLNCGLSTGPASQPATIQALLAWIRAGGTLYASDWAMDYVSALIPQDTLGLETGSVQSVAASVTDSGLQAFIGKSTVQIRYNLPAWIGLRQLSSRPRVLLRGSYQASASQALASGFQPASTSLNRTALSVTPSALVSDRVLAFVVTEGSGRIVYTTFHNEMGVTDDQIAVLRYYVYIE